MKMPKMNKQTAVTAALIGVSVLAVYLIFKGRIRREMAYQMTDGALSSDSTPDREKTLKRGSIGREVMLLQEMLVRDGMNIGQTGRNRNGVDGDFGPKTETALMTLTGQKEITLNQYEQAKAAHIAVKQSEAIALDAENLRVS